jgi:hypothetical protein
MISGTYLEIQADAPSEHTSRETLYVLQIILKETIAGKRRLAEHSDAHILRSGVDFLHSILNLAAADHYSIICRNFDFDAADRGKVLSTTKARSRLRDLKVTSPKYPVVFWISPNGCGKCKIAIDDWFAEVHSNARLRVATDSGGIWVSIADVFLDVVASADSAPVLLRWLRSAEPNSEIGITWNMND